MAKQPAKPRKSEKTRRKPAAKPKVVPESEGTSKAPSKRPAKRAAAPASTVVATPLIDRVPAEAYPAQERPAATPPPAEKAASKPAAEGSVTASSPAADPAALRAGRGAGLGTIPLFLGGLAAGAIGFAVASLSTPAADSELADTLASQQGSVNALEDRLARLDREVRAGGADDLSAQITGVTNQLEALALRVAALEAAPAPAGNATGLQQEVTAALSAEMDALRARISELTGAAATELAEARAAAATIEENATAAAQTAAARAALARVQMGLETGAPLGTALRDLGAALMDDLPAELAAVAGGVPTLAALQESFPDAARTALAQARREGVAGEATGGLGAFLRNQFDVRSTTPQEGDSTDAILSRAEAAMQAGRLSDALAEISALPEVARAAMTDWRAAAEARADAIAAADLLSLSLSAN